MERKQQAIELKRKGLTYAAIGKQLGVSRQRVQQMILPPKPLRDMIMKRANFACEYCKVSLGKSGDIHHIGGADYDFNDTDNLKYLCKQCHMDNAFKNHLVPPDGATNNHITLESKSDIKCPRCGSVNFRKAARTIRENKLVQRYFCKDCKKGFTEPK